MTNEVEKRAKKYRKMINGITRKQFKNAQNLVIMGIPGNALSRVELMCMICELNEQYQAKLAVYEDHNADTARLPKDSLKPGAAA